MSTKVTYAPIVSPPHTCHVSRQFAKSGAVLNNS